MMKARQLSREEFEAALQRGQGRAFLHVRKYGLQNVADLLLEACLHDKAYDPQCEDSRAEWLLEMFRDSSEYEIFATSILTALGNETEGWDLLQSCEIAALMALNGDEEAHSALLLRVMRQSEGIDDNWVGASELVRVEGVDAVVKLARNYGNLLLKNPDEEPPPLAQLYDGNVPIEARNTLEELSSADPKIRAYWEHNLRDEAQGSYSKEKYHERIRREYPLQKILEYAAAEAGKYPNYYLSFGRTATQEELEIVFSRLITEPNEQVCMRLLWVFRRVEMPRLHPRLWVFVKSNNEQLRNAAFKALSQISDLAIGEFARQKLRNGESIEENSELLDLLVHNYQPGDGDIILNAIQEVKTGSENTHWIGLSILDICDENEAPDLYEALKWIYENGPCSCCRQYSVERIVKLKMIDPEVIEECLFDANGDLQKIARELQASQ